MCPMTITHDGAELTVFTQHEFNEATKDLRLKVESDTKAKYEPQLAELTQKVTALEPLQAQVTNLTQERDALKGERDGLARVQSFTKVAREKGLADNVIELALNQKGFDSLAMDDAPAVETFLTPFTALVSTTTPPAKEKPGTGGSPTGAAGTPLSAEAIAAQTHGGDLSAVTGDNWAQTRQALDFGP